MSFVRGWANSQPVAAKPHYLQTTDARFEQATETGPGAAQKAAQLGPEMLGKGPYGRKEAVKKPYTSREIDLAVTPTGLEPVLPA